MSRKSSKLDIAIELGYLAIFLFCPVYFDIFLYQVFPISSQTIFYGLLEITLFFWALKIIFNFSEFKRNLKFYGKYLLPFFIFIIFVSVSTLFSRSPSFSFWGSYERCFGLLTWIHLFLFYALLIFNLKTKEQLIRLIGVIFGAVLAVVGYGILQLNGVDFLEWYEKPSETYRVFSSLGQPNFLASWLLFILPLISWVFLYCFNLWHQEKKSILFPFFAFLLFAFVFFVFLFTQSRGGWLGLIGQISALGLFLLWYFKKKRLFFLFLTIVFGVAAFLIVFNLYHFNYSISEKSLSPITGRLKSIAYLGGGSGRLRLIFWKDGLDLISRRPIFGYGPETQRFYYVSYYRPEFAALEAINSYPDRAHNDIVDTLLTTGVLGLISYLSFIGMVFYWGLKRVMSKFDFSGSIILALLAGIFGYLISIQFSFHIIPTAVYFIGLMAAIVSFSLKYET